MVFGAGLDASGKTHFIKLVRSRLAKYQINGGKLFHPPFLKRQLPQNWDSVFKNFQSEIFLRLLLSLSFHAPRPPKTPSLITRAESRKISPLLQVLMKSELSVTSKS